MKLMNRRKFALLSGLLLLLMALSAGYAFGYVYQKLVIPENSIETYSNLTGSTFLFGTCVAGWLLIVITDFLVSWGLYNYFLKVNKILSLITATFRIVYSCVLTVAVMQLIIAWYSIYMGTSDHLSLMNYLNEFEYYWSLGLIIFGFHLVGLGYLSVKSSEVPKWIGVLLYIAGPSYIIIHTANFIIPSAANSILIMESVLSLPMALAEIGLAFWLVFRGGKISQIMINNAL